jgi:hypothetical protein
VDDPGAVRGREAGQHGIHDRDRLRDRQPLLLAQEVAQRDAGQVLHDEVGHLAVLALVEDVDHVRVGEARGGARLLDEPALEDRVVREVPVHHLQGDAALEAQVGRDVHGRHSAAGDASTHRYRPSTRRPISGSVCWLVLTL